MPRGLRLFALTMAVALALGGCSAQRGDALVIEQAAGELLRAGENEPGRVFDVTLDGRMRQTKLPLLYDDGEVSFYAVFEERGVAAVCGRTVSYLPEIEHGEPHWKMFQMECHDYDGDGENEYAAWGMDGVPRYSQLWMLERDGESLTLAAHLNYEGFYEAFQRGGELTVTALPGEEGSAVRTLTTRRDGQEITAEIDFSGSADCGEEKPVWEWEFEVGPADSLRFRLEEDGTMTVEQPVACMQTEWPSSVLEYAAALRGEVKYRGGAFEVGSLRLEQADAP